MTTLKEFMRLGTAGPSVASLQRSLNEQGYNLKEDGVFGNKTQAAVKDYQKNNALAVDGVVGTKTWASLSGGTNAASTPSGSTRKNQNTTAKKEFSYDDFSYGDYVESDTVAQAQAALNAAQAAKPGAYSSQWKAQIDDIISRIAGRKDFSYDVNGDALYQQYKDQYIQQGKMAMQDTMGQAAAMTGGYGNSYAAAVGNQAYQGYLQQINDKVPELYQMAYDRYQQEGQDMLDLYALYSDQEDSEYGRYRDSVADYLTERDYATSRYDSERSYDYSKYTDERNFDYGQYSDDKSYAYDEYRNAIADEQWQKQYDESVRQYNESIAEDKRQFDESMSFSKTQYEDSKKASSSSSSGGSSGGSSGSGSSNKGTSGTTKTSGVSDSIRSKLDGIKSNSAAEAYLENLEASGAIDHETALQLMSEYLDVNEVYTDNEDGSKSVSYSGMVKSTNGWKVVDDGGANWFWGVDNNAIVEAPNGERVRLDDLVDKLVSEGMSKSDAKNYVKKLQKNLKI